VIESEICVEEIDDFYIGGELKTLLPLMPGEKYSFHYTVVPLQIGRLALPKFHISEVLDSGDKLSLIKGFTQKVLILK
jgi:Gryzun, putative Golgi trafficking